MKIALDVFINDTDNGLLRIPYGCKPAASMEVRCSFVSASIQLRTIVEMSLW